MKQLILSIVFLTIFSAAAQADPWSEWISLNGVPISFSSANIRGFCAFRFRNDSDRRLSGGRIHFTHGGNVENDILIGMRPGQIHGGWAAYSVEDRCSNVEIQLYDLDWR